MSQDISSEANLALLVAVLAAKQEIPAIKKSADNPFFKSKYASLDVILETIEPVLFKNKLFISQSVQGSTLVTRLYHVGGAFLESCFALQEGLDAQKTGSAITYARRYSIGSLLCLTLDDDDDGNAASGKVSQLTPETFKTSTQKKVAPRPSSQTSIF